MDCTTWGTARTVHPKDFGQLMKREACALGRGDPLEIPDFALGPDSVSGARTLRLRHEPDSLIVADAVRPDASETRKLADG